MNKRGLGLTQFNIMLEQFDKAQGISTKPPSEDSDLKECNDFLLCQDCKQTEQKLKARVSTHFCLDCTKLCCSQCMVKQHRNKDNTWHNTESIDEYRERIQQTVYVINSKLDNAIAKLRFLSAQLILVGGLEAKAKSEQDTKACALKDPNFDPNNISLEYVLEMSVQSRTHSEQALQQMRANFEPFIFLKFLEDIRSLYEI